jgi:hypothetical protein
LSFRTLIKWLIDIPPVEQRPDLRGALRQWVFTYYDRTERDSFLFYRIYILNLAANLAICTLFLLPILSRSTLDIGFVRIDYSDKLFDDFLRFYPHVIVPILMFVSAGYGLLTFVLQSEVLSLKSARDYVASAQYYEFYNQPILRYLGTIAFCVVCLPNLDAIPNYFRGYRLFRPMFDFDHPSAGLIVFFMAVYVFLFQLFIVSGFMFSVIMLARRALLKLTSSINK